uniref:Tail protein n=1 Tax=viral metagenome TaxID=1070528 RepID=A0A6M3XDG1_9ZZZZ
MTSMYVVLGDLDLNSDEYVTMSLEDTTGRKKAIWTDPGVTRSGRERTEVSYPNKTLQLVIGIRPQDTTAELETALRAVYQEIVRADDPDDTLWLYYRPVADASWTTIRKIKVLHADCTVPVDNRMWKAMVLSGIEMELECEEAWRGDEVEVSFVEDDSDVENAHDGSRENFLTIATADVEGDLPAFCRIEVVSSGGGYTAWRIAQKDDFTGNLTLEFSGTVNAVSSGGEYYIHTGLSTEWGTVQGKIVSAQEYYGLYRAFARVRDIAGTGGNLYLRARWGTSEGLDVVPTEASRSTNAQHRVKPVYASSTIETNVWVDVPLGIVDFRESTWKRGDYEPVYFSVELQAKRTSGTEWCHIDRIYLMPLDDGYLWAGRVSGVSDWTNKLVIDSDENRVYVVTSDGSLRFYPSVDGRPFRLNPHTSIRTRVYFLWEEDQYPSQNIIQFAGSNRQAAVTMYYTPRYL